VPSLTVDGLDFFIPINLTLLDTNVLCSMVLVEEHFHETTCLFLEMEERTWGVIPSVIIEAWGLLVGSKKRKSEALQLITWLLTPSSTLILLPEITDGLRVHGSFMREHDVDIVDAKLIETAHIISERCEFAEAIDIATYDSRDFRKCERKKTGFKFRVRHLEYE
jgi:predicted nucleic acid-binding protein